MKNTFTRKNLVAMLLVMLIAMTTIFMTGCDKEDVVAPPDSVPTSIDIKYQVANDWIEKYNDKVDDDKYLVGDRSYSKSDNCAYVLTESFEYVLELDENKDVWFFELSNGDVADKLAVIKYTSNTLYDRNDLPEDVNSYLAYLIEKDQYYKSFTSNNLEADSEFLGPLNTYIGLRIWPEVSFEPMTTVPDVPAETTYEIIYN